MANTKVFTYYLICVMFIVPGVLKVVYINQKVTQAMLRSFKQYSDVFPLTFIGLRPPERSAMEVVGVCEIVLGTIVGCGLPGPRRTSLFMLIALMVLAVYSQLMNYDFQAAFLSLVYLGLLGWVTARN